MGPRSVLVAVREPAYLGPLAGVARTAQRHASFYACEDCVHRLHHTILDYSDAMDDAPVDADEVRLPLYVGAADPVRPRTALGRLWGRVVSGREVREVQAVRTETAAKR